MKQDICSITKRIFLFFPLLATILLVMPPAVLAAVDVGDSPNIELTTVNGLKIDKQYYEGKLVIIDFWASWCSSCVDTIPHMKKLHTEHSSQNIKFLGVNSDRSKETLLKFVADKELNWLQYYDPERTLGNLWGIPGLPTVFLLSPRGKVLWTGNPAQLDWELAKAMKEYFQKGEMLDKLKKNTAQALIDADTAFQDGDYGQMLRAFSKMDSGAVEDKEILKASLLIFNTLKMAQDHGTVYKIQTAIQADKEGGRAFSNMLTAIDKAGRAQGTFQKSTKDN